ncbi:asparagine synthase (glutamine-hydrolyzing) [Magnetococcus sp. PR-3]|uniref:asparagine synthase (glutamine-hydrolyzing) n=1 Tax=Magnetococcus sp. PR-3 TaxID=3120355 RepID=UPI002FCE5ED0
MCGILGWVGPGVAEPKQAKAQTMPALKALRPRGPDGEGLEAGQHWVLGHTRLAIQDLSAGGYQPMRAEQGSLLTFNGEIYNYRELKQELQALNYRFNSTSDTEVLLQALNCWGIAALQKLHGMFAFAWLDPQNNRLILARDRFGVKPLCYTYDQENFCFASDLHSLRKLPMTSLEVDPISVRNFLTLGYIPSPRSILKNVAKLLPGHHMSIQWNSSKVDVGTQTPYYSIASIPPNTTHLSADDRLNAYKAHVEQAVDYRLVSDVPVGTLMSGGIDSTMVTLLSGQLTGGDITSYTMGFKGSALDESTYAQQITEHIGLQNIQFQLGDSLDALQQAFTVFDEPFADESLLPTLSLTEQVAQHTKVVLSGDGGDEAAFGYSWHHQMQQLNPWNRLPPWMRKLVGFWAPRIRPTCRATAVTIAQKDRMSQWLAMRGWKDSHQINRYPVVDSMQLEPLAESFTWQSGELSKIHDPLEWVGRLDLMLYLPENLMVKIDRTSMAHGLEVREPLLDHTLMEWLLSLPKENRYDSQKGLSKVLSHQLLAEHLPKRLFERPKQGFIPDSTKLWEGELRRTLEQTIHQLEKHALLPVALPEPFQTWASYAQHIGPSAPNLLWRITCFRLWLENHKLYTRSR